MNPSDVTVIIPFDPLAEFDTVCLRHVTTRIAKELPGISILVPIHDPPPGFHIDSAAILPFHHKKRRSNKSHMVSIAMSAFKTGVVWIHAYDAIMPFKRFLDTYRDGCVSICGGTRTLDYNTTAGFLTTDKIPAIEYRSCGYRDDGTPSMIFRRDLYDIVGMDVDIEGWKWSELDFVVRSSVKADIIESNIGCLRLSNGEDIRRGDGGEALFKNKCRHITMYFDMMGQYKPSNAAPIPMANIRIKEWNPNIPNVKQEWNPARFTNMTSSISENGKIVHIIAPALEFGKDSLRRRESFALESIKRALEYDGAGVEIVLYTDGKESPYPGLFSMVEPTRSSKDIGDKRCLPYLSDMLLEARTRAGVGGAVVYTNSDNSVVVDFYRRIRECGRDRVLYHRRNVHDCPTTLEELFTFKNEVFEPGVDGVMFKGRGWDGMDVIPADFFIGEPHWDSAFGGYLYKHGMASRDVDCLYHPYHTQAWSNDTLSAAGRVNYDLFCEYVGNGLSDQSILLTLKAPKASVVIVHYGDDPVRLKAVGECLGSMENQCFEGEVVVVELVFDGKSHLPPLSSKFRKIVVAGDSGNMGIWQKEAMMNIGVEAADNDIIVFVDSDLRCGTCDWIDRIARKVHADPESMVHGYRICSDSIYPEQYRFLSYGAMIAGGMVGDMPHNPGLTWGISRRILRENGGVNPYCLYGNGDSLLLAEYLGERYSECNDWCVREVSMMRNLVRRGLRQCRVDYVDEDVTHINHGQPMTLTHYGSKNLMTRHFSKSMDKLVVMDSNGLLRWVDPGCHEREMIRRRGEMVDSAAVDRICGEISSGMDGK